MPLRIWTWIAEPCFEKRTCIVHLGYLTSQKITIINVESESAAGPRPSSRGVRSSWYRAYGKDTFPPWFVVALVELCSVSQLRIVIIIISLIIIIITITGSWLFRISFLVSYDAQRRVRDSMSNIESRYSLTTTTHSILPDSSLHKTGFDRSHCKVGDSLVLAEFMRPASPSFRHYTNEYWKITESAAYL